MYYPDLSPYEYSDIEFPIIYTAVLNVGWLALEHEFCEGEVPPDFLRKLSILYRSRVNRTRGFHLCEFCDEIHQFPTLKLDGQDIGMGTSEIELRSGKEVFRAPDLLYHYVECHRYKPPQKFIEAVLDLY